MPAEVTKKMAGVTGKELEGMTDNKLKKKISSSEHRQTILHGIDELKVIIENIRAIPKNG